MTKAPTPTEMSKRESDNTNNATKSSITQRLQTDLERSVGVTTVKLTYNEHGYCEFTFITKFF